MSSGYLPGGAPVGGDSFFGNLLGDISNAFSGIPTTGLLSPSFSNVQAGSSTMSMAPYGGLPGGMAVGSPYYTNAAGMTKLANRFSPDGVHVYVARGRPLLFSGDVAAVKRVRRVGRLCHRFFPSRSRSHSRRRYR